eukprot:IDg910t1
MEEASMMSAKRLPSVQSQQVCSKDNVSSNSSSISRRSMCYRLLPRKRLHRPSVATGLACEDRFWFCVLSKFCLLKR